MQIERKQKGAEMERLTVYTPDGYESINPVDLCLDEYSGINFERILDKLGKYEDFEEQGLLLRLPCKVGDTIYVNGILGVGEAEEYKVIRVDYHSNLATKRSEFYIEALLVSDPRNSIGFYDKEIGKTVFLTQSEAEAKLKELRGGEND